MRGLVFAIALMVPAAVCAPAAQTSPAPTRLALIADPTVPAAAVDLLTVELGKDTGLALLERVEIDRLFREQALSHKGKDALKLGRILGAGGLLVLDLVPGHEHATLSVRLLAVNPGVVIASTRMPWSGEVSTQWAAGVARYFGPFWAKLNVLAKDAVPISVVNFRSAVSSAEAQQTERQLTALAIERLTRERTLFVLERRRMELLAREKEFDLDESAFWSGAYLLDGVLDPQSYSEDILIVSARLVPPKGGAPLVFEISGPRTNLAGIVDQLVANVVGLLKLTPTVTEWNAAEEAQQFFAEATWALRWKMYPEAQAAAESAWALGKRNLECALVRIRAYVDEVPGILPTNVMLYYGGKRDLRYIRVDEPLDSRFCDNALYTLQCYYEFCRTSPEGVPMVITCGPHQTERRNSDWYQLGLDVLEATSSVLQYYCFRPGAQDQVKDKLPQLRALARQVADFISEAPSVRDSYFVGGRRVKYDELANTICASANIFSCMLKWGCFWQERPEDAVALYRRLMSSPVFCFIHRDFWFREPLQPRLVAWNEADRKSIPSIAQAFLNELSNSTNPLLRLEAKALQLAHANTDEEAVRAFNDLFDTMMQNRDVFVANNVDLLHTDWGVYELLNRFQEGVSVDTRETLRARYNTVYGPMLKAWHKEAERQTEQSHAAERAVRMLKQAIDEDKPLDEFQFFGAISELRGAKQHTSELLPLLGAYKSNLSHKTAGLAGVELAKMRFKIQHVDSWQKMIEQIAAKPEPEHRPGVSGSAGQSMADLRQVGQISTPTANAQGAAPATAPPTLLYVTNYVQFPVDHLKTGKPNENIHELKLNLLGISGGKLWFDLRYVRNYVVYFDRGSRWEGDAEALLAGLNLQDFSWELLPFPARQERAGSLFLLPPECAEFAGAWLFVSGIDYLHRYDFKAGRWERFSVPWQLTPRLFPISGRLYAANEEAIYEILDGGRNIKILASCRRRPAVTKLDLLSALQRPKLFGSSNYPVVVSIAEPGTNRVYGWDGTDWHELFSLNVSQPPDVFEEVVVFRGGLSIPGSQSKLWVWDKTSPAPTLWVVQTPKTQPFQQRPVVHPFFVPPRARESAPAEKSRWTLSSDVSLTHCGLAFHRSNLYLFADHAVLTNVAGTWRILEKDGYHAELVCLRDGLPGPLVVPLKFDVTRGDPPLMALGLKKIPFVWEARLPSLAFTDDVLCIAHSAIPGVWLINLAELEKILAGQKPLPQPEFTRLQETRPSPVRPPWQTNLPPVGARLQSRPDPGLGSQHQTQTQ